MVDVNASVREAQRKVEQAQRALREALAEKTRVESLTPERALAEHLHEAMCRWNHTDGCSWLYETSRGNVNWSGYAHNEWLGKAKEVMALLPDVPPEQVLKVAQALKS